MQIVSLLKTCSMRVSAALDGGYSDLHLLSEKSMEDSLVIIDTFLQLMDWRISHKIFT
jgi:hypothetical protein